jgi:hypothetical protein
MITMYHSDERQAPAANPRSNLLPPMGEAFWIWREMRRYEFAAEKMREAGLRAYADLYDGFAEQARMEILALAKVDDRIGTLDAKLAGGAK